MKITDELLSTYFGDDTSSGKTCDCVECLMKEEIKIALRLKEFITRDATELGASNFIGSYLFTVMEEAMTK